MITGAFCGHVVMWRALLPEIAASGLCDAQSR